MTDKFFRDQRFAEAANPSSSRWLPATLLAAGVLTVAAIGFVALRDPVTPVVAEIPGLALPAQAGAPIDDGANRDWQGVGTTQTGDAELSEWEEQRENELVEQRRAGEMVANTPGVTADQYVGEGDDSAYVEEGEEDEWE